MKIEWYMLQLPGGTAFLACLLGCYGFAYDTRMKAYGKLADAVKGAAA